MLLYLYLIIGVIICLFAFKLIDYVKNPDVMIGFNTEAAAIIFKILVCLTEISFWPLVLLIALTNDNEKNS